MNSVGEIMKHSIWILLSSLFIFAVSAQAKDLSCIAGIVRESHSQKIEKKGIAVGDLAEVVKEAFTDIDPTNQCRYSAIEIQNKGKTFPVTKVWGISKLGGIRNASLADGTVNEIIYYAKKLRQVNSDDFNTVCGYTCQ